MFAKSVTSNIGRYFNSEMRTRQYQKLRPTSVCLSYTFSNYFTSFINMRKKHTHYSQDSRLLDLFRKTTNFLSCTLLTLGPLLQVSSLQSDLEKHFRIAGKVATLWDLTAHLYCIATHNSERQEFKTQHIPMFFILFSHRKRHFESLCSCYQSLGAPLARSEIEPGG